MNLFIDTFAKNTGNEGLWEIVNNAAIGQPKAHGQ